MPSTRLTARNSRHPAPVILCAALRTRSAATPPPNWSRVSHSGTQDQLFRDVAAMNPKPFLCHVTSLEEQTLFALALDHMSSIGDLVGGFLTSISISKKR